jgi:hypothetical protein
MTPFLDCNIFSITYDSFNEYYVIAKVYKYNSNTEEFNTPIPPGFTQIPEFEIDNLNLLQNLDYNFINKFKIPIIKREDSGRWKIDLKYYEDTYIQYTNNQ